MGNLLTWTFWFNLRPEPLTALFQNSILGIAIILAAFYVFTKIVSTRKTKTLYHRIWLRLGTFSLTNAILGILFWFFSYEMVPILSAKFLLGLWAILIILWIVWIIKQIRRVPQRKQELEKEKEFRKYIP